MPSLVPGPCEPEDLIDGIIFAANYLGSTQLLSERNPSKNIRMMQAQEAVSRVKVLVGSVEPWFTLLGVAGCWSGREGPQSPPHRAGRPGVSGEAKGSIGLSGRNAVAGLGGRCSWLLHEETPLGPWKQFLKDDCSTAFHS